MGFRDAVTAVDAALASGQLGSRDAELRVRLTQDLEAEAKGLPDPPSVEDSKPSSKLARLVWYKCHQDRLDVEYVFDALSDPDEVVRLTAAEVLAFDVRTSRRWADASLNTRMRQALGQHLAHEGSATVTMQLSEVTKQLQQGRRRRLEPAPAPERPNPYVTGLPVRGAQNFFDRECIIRDIGQAIETNRHTIIVDGARRTGKTSLLYRIRDGVLGPDYVTAYIDMQSLAGLPLPQLLRNFMRAVESALWEKKISGISPTDDGEVHFGALEMYFTRVLSQMQGGRLVLLIDEYEVLESYLSDDDVRHQLQALLSRDWKVFAIFAGEKMEAIGEKRLLSLLDNAAYLKITFLNPEDSRQLITQPSRGSMEFSADAIDFIQELCAGHPFYTQLLCQSIYSSKKGAGTVSRKDVDSAVARFIENPAPNLLLSWKQNLTLTERVVAAALASASAAGAVTASPAPATTVLKNIATATDNARWARRIRAGAEAVPQVRFGADDESRLVFVVEGTEADEVRAVAGELHAARFGQAFERDVF